jgi:putative heme iron utilization protein
MTMPEPHDADPLPDNNRLALRQVARACRKASLATILAGSGGAPYASLVTVAFGHDLSPILLLSRLSDHTKNLLADPRASLLLDGTEGHPNPQTGPRVTLTGLAEQSGDPGLKARFLGRHPAAALYAGFADFAIWRIVPERAHFVGGFGRAVWFDAPFGLAAAPVAADEPRLLAELNARHAAELDGWAITAIDADGVDMLRCEEFRRLAFPQPVDAAASLGAAVAGLFRPQFS